MKYVDIRVVLDDGIDPLDGATQDGLTNAIETFEAAKNATIIGYGGEDDPS